MCANGYDVALLVPGVEDGVMSAVTDLWNYSREAEQCV
jgi:hypothetical protein